MNIIFFYIYLISIIIVTTIFILARCVFDFHDLDVFFYPNHNNNIVSNYIYLISHILVNFFLGVFFGFEITRSKSASILSNKTIGASTSPLLLGLGSVVLILSSGRTLCLVI